MNADSFVIKRAKFLATKILANAGVRLEWSNHAEGEIRIEMVAGVARFHPGALAYAAPFTKSGIRVRVFYDRVLETRRGIAAAEVLAHVFAHEIVHILAGTDGHSISGLMKAEWGKSDYNRNGSWPIAFHEERS